MRAFHTAVAFGVICGGCVADVPAYEAGPHLTVTSVRDDGVDATLRIDGVELAVSSQLELRPPLLDVTDALVVTSAPIDEMVRTTMVRRANGDVVASFSVAVADGETTGTIADQPFGRPIDEASDGDADLWTAIMGSADGRVIDALSQAASESLDAGADPRAVPFMSDAFQLSPVLHDYAAPPADIDAPYVETSEAADTAQHHITTLGWNFGSGPNARVLLIPNVNNVIGIHSADNNLDTAAKLDAIRANPTSTLGIRELEPYNYNTSRAYRRMTARLVAEAQRATGGTQPILLMFNSGSNGSHDPMSTLPGIEGSDGARRPTVARALRTLLRNHPEVRFAVELYCSGDMTADGWTSRRVQLGRWAAKVGIARDRITIDEDLSNTTPSSGEHYGTQGNVDHFNAMLSQEAYHVFHGGWGGVDYVATPPTGMYPTLQSTYDVVRQIMTTY